MERVFVLGIVGDDEVKEFNEKYETDHKTMDEQLHVFFDEVIDMIENSEKDGWYTGDCIEIRVSVKYKPEDK